jgi:hypothetical protein
MTLGQFLPLAALFAGLVEIALGWLKLRSLPTRAEPNYDESVAAQARAYRLIIGAGVALPILMFAAVRFVFPPDLAAMELF